MAIIGIDIGGTNFRIGLVDADGAVSAFYKVPISRVFVTQDPLADLAGYLKAYSEGKTVDAVAIGFPATLDAGRQTVLQAPNIAFMENLPVVDVLTKALGVPVFIERDVTFALVYDCEKYGIDKEGIVCGFYFGTGMGNAIAVGGKPLIGKNGTAGELGHIPADGNALQCGCGNTGCLETLAGGKYLAHLCETVYTQTHISDIFTKHGSEPLLLQFVDRLAMAVATEVNILDPHGVLIGGGVPAMADFPREYLEQRILARTRKPLPADSLHVIFAEDEPEKSVAGAAIYVRNAMYPV